VEREQISKSFKLLTLRAMVRRGWLWSPAPIDELAEEMRGGLLGDPRLLRDVADATSPDPATADRDAWRAYVRKNPVAAWAGELRYDPSTAAFTVVDDGLAAKLRVPEADRPAVEELVAELVEWRLVRYIEALAVDGEPSAAVARLKVARNTGDRPILFLRRDQNPPLPHGEVEVLIEGEVHLARFVKVACNVITKPGEPTNLLPDHRATVVRRERRRAGHGPRGGLLRLGRARLRSCGPGETRGTMRRSCGSHTSASRAAETMRSTSGWSACRIRPSCSTIHAAYRCHSSSRRRGRSLPGSERSATPSSRQLLVLERRTETSLDLRADRHEIVPELAPERRIGRIDVELDPQTRSPAEPRGVVDAAGARRQRQP
jgi:hypothetical protein